MKFQFYTALFTTISLGIVSCKTASKMYQKGNYNEAVELAANKLQKKPGDPELMDILKNAYTFAVNDHESRIRNYAASNNELKWEWMYNEYASLQRLYQAVYKAPSVQTIINPVNYSSQLTGYAEKAGLVRYQRGVAFMQRYDKQSYRQAYREFQTALRFLPGDRETIRKMNEAYEYAVINVIVLPIQQHGGYINSSYSSGINSFDEVIIQNLVQDRSQEFVRFYSIWEAQNRNIRMDYEVEIQMAGINIGHYDDYRTTRKASREVVIRERVIKPDSVVRDFGWVYANITTTRRTKNSNALLTINVRDQNGRWIWSDNVVANHNWSTEFTDYSGDARALSDADRQIIERRRDFSPTESEILRALFNQLDDAALWKIKNYFNRY